MSYSPKELNSHSILRNKFSKSVAEGPGPACDPRRSEYENFAYHPKENNPPIVATQTSLKRFELNSDLKKNLDADKQKKFIKLFYNQHSKQASRQSLPKLKFVKVSKNQSASGSK